MCLGSPSLLPYSCATTAMPAHFHRSRDVAGWAPPHLLPRRSPAPPPLGTNPSPILDPPKPIFLSHRRGFKGSRSPLQHPFPFSPSPPFPLRVKLFVARYTPPCRLLSKPGHQSIPEAIGRHRPPAAEVVMSTSCSGRPPVLLSRWRAPCWLPSPPQPPSRRQWDLIW
jgi:hypothetical protein